MVCYNRWANIGTILKPKSTADVRARSLCRMCSGFWQMGDGTYPLLQSHVLCAPSSHPSLLPQFYFYFLGGYIIDVWDYVSFSYTAFRYTAVLLTVVTMIYTASSGLIYFVTGNLCLWLPLPPFCPPRPWPHLWQLSICSYGKPRKCFFFFLF